MSDEIVASGQSADAEPPKAAAADVATSPVREAPAEPTADLDQSQVNPKSPPLEGGAPHPVSDGQPPLAPSTADQNSKARGHDLRDFIFYRELAEVYLLLDNLSSALGKTIPPPREPNQATGDPGERDWISDICKIGWPPTGSAADRDAQAATLIRARDRLNTLADPASGYTIAFTSLVTEQLSKMGHEPKASENLGKSKPGGFGEPTLTDPYVKAGAGWAANVPSSYVLANIAYPGLTGPAVKMVRFRKRIIAGFIALFLATSFLSWNVAVGTALLAQLNTAQSLNNGATKSQAAVSDHAATTSQQADNSAACTADSACGKVARAQDNLHRWSAFWRWLGVVWKSTCVPTAANCDPDNDLWTSTFLGVLGGAVLPILYGVLGAGVSVIRSFSDRVKDNRLAPRHRVLMLNQLVLGAVLGGCIGIFATPATAAGTGLFAAVPLSASALSFLAGFAVDGVFQALDSAIRRVFNLRDPSEPVSSPSSVKK